MDIVPHAVTDRIVQAIDAHDLDGLAACFAVDVSSETPAHPSRDFIGRDQVRRNWSRIFEAVPDIEAHVVRLVVDGTTEWTELEFRGHRRDGGSHRMRGVTVNTVAAGVVTNVRFYVEPVDDAPIGADAAVERILDAQPTGSAR